MEGAGAGIAYLGDALIQGQTYPQLTYVGGKLSLSWDCQQPVNYLLREPEAPDVQWLAHLVAEVAESARAANRLR